MRMWHKRESFRLFPTCNCDQNGKELVVIIRDEQDTIRINNNNNYFHGKPYNFSLLFVMIVMFSTISLSVARPYNKTSAVISPPVELPHANSSHSANVKERTRILTRPRPIRTSSNHQHGEDEDDEDDDDQHIVFPDSLETFEPAQPHATITFEPVARLDVVPDCAAGNTFCEDIPTYPYKLLRDVLGRSKTADNVLFGMDETPDEIAQRIGEPEENYICGAIDKTVYPKVGKTKNNKWKYIINQGSRDGYVQGVRVETCVSMGKPCDLFGSQPNGYITSCKQKFIYRKMLSLSEGGQPIPDTFLMPSACCCSYKRDNRFLARFGALPATPVT